MRPSEGPFGDEPSETESRRLTPSIGLATTHDSDSPTDSSNEDFLFHLYRGSELLQDNRVHEAKEELERALHLQPRDSKGQDLLAVVYFRLGLYPRAIQIYEQLRRRNTNDTALLLNLALCYLKTGQPQLARRDLEHLLSINTNHARAWGYLGLACERIGDLAQAQRAFEQGGHTQMAKRIAARREAAAPQDQPSPEVREVAGAAYQELDAGELSFALAEPSNERSQNASAQSWQAHELGQVKSSDRAADIARPETRKPDTRDGPKSESNPAPAGVVPSIPQLGLPHSLNRRPTLIAPVGAPPAHEHGAPSEFAALEQLRSHHPPSFTLDDAGSPGFGPPSVRRPVVAVPSPFGPAKHHEMNLLRSGTLPPPNAGIPASNRTAASPPYYGEAPLPVVSPSAPPETDRDPPEAAAAPVPPPPVPAPLPIAELEPEAIVPSLDLRASAPVPPAPLAAPQPPPPRRESEAVRFPASGVELHPSGVALVQATAEVPFAARLESIRAQQSGLEMKVLERHMKGKPTGESFGGVSSPMILASGQGQLVLGPRAGRKLTAFSVDEEMCFAREDVLLGFSGSLSFENGRLTTGEGEFLPVVQLRGQGGVLFESIGGILMLPVRSERSLSVRREVILGWFGRLVPRAIAPSDAPCGQRGLVSFAGEGRVLVASV